jgi:transcriptional regulator GlxA family with amidase domain
MLTVGFVVTPGFPVMSLAALSVFEFANLSAESELYGVQMLSEDGGPVPTTLGTSLDTVAFGDAHFDTLIIGGNTRVVPTSAKLLAFVAEAAKTSRRISSICTGAFVLADAGLLDDRRATTHWLFTEQLKSHYPGIRLEQDRIFVIDGSLWTAAGNSAGIDLTLCMLENDYGHDLALSVAQILVVDYQRSGGQSQHSALLEINPKSDRIQAVLAYARRNLQTPLLIENLAQVAGLSPRQFSRAFRAETGMSPAKAIENVRLDAARLMTEQSRHPVDVIATETGFGDQERMRRAFLRVFGHPPQAMRRMAQGGQSATTSVLRSASEV